MAAEHRSPDGVAETTPLLPPPPASSSPAPEDDRHPHINRDRFVAIGTMIVFFTEIGFALTIPPINALMEAAICRSYLPSSNTADLLVGGGDPRCKSPDVQGELAMVSGWLGFFEAIPGLLVALPIGMLADRIGRRPMLLLALAGMLLEYIWMAVVLAAGLPVRMIYLGPAFTLVGSFGLHGGGLLYTMAGDIIPAAKRAAVFFQVSVGLLLGEIVSGPLTGWLMDYGGPWLPMCLGLTIAVGTTAMVLLLPETLPKKDRAPLLVDLDGEDGAASRHPLAQEILATVRDSLVDLGQFVRANTHLFVLFAPLAFFVLGRCAQGNLLQYATKRYGLSWSEASYLLTTRSVANLLLFLFVFPSLGRLCTTTLKMTPAARDLSLTRAAGAVGALGAVSLGLAPTPGMMAAGLVPFAFGYGFSPLLRSLLAGLVEARHLATVNSLISFLDLVGVLVASPALSWALRAGIRLGGPWVGLPFGLAAVSFAVGTGMVWMFKLSEEER